MLSWLTDPFASDVMQRALAEVNAEERRTAAGDDTEPVVTGSSMAVLSA